MKKGMHLPFMLWSTTNNNRRVGTSSSKLCCIDILVNEKQWRELAEFVSSSSTKSIIYTYCLLVIYVHKDYIKGYIKCKSHVSVLGTSLMEKFYRNWYCFRRPWNLGYKWMKQWASKLYRKRKLVFIRPTNKVAKNSQLLSLH